jgi:LuxR family maltose regulon positive regulatory protein
MLEGWLRAAEATLTASLTTQTHENASHIILSSEVRQEQENLLGEVIATRAFLHSPQEDGQVTHSLCQQALALLSADNFMVRVVVATTQLVASYSSSINDAVAAIQCGLQAGQIAQEAGQTALAIGAMSTGARYMIGAGRLHEAIQLTQRAMLLGTNLQGLVLPEVGWSAVFQADILREWNHLDAALSLIEEALLQCEQTKSLTSLTYLIYGHAVLLRVLLSRGELPAARAALQQVEQIGKSFNRPYYIYTRSFFTTIDQVRLWLACGELDHATRWAQRRGIAELHDTSFIHEREEVAYARILIAKDQPTLALQRLEPVLQRATVGKRWGHVIEIRLLQALAYQMCHKVSLALETLSEAVRLTEPEGYIRSFVDEGASMESLLAKLREQQRQHGPTSYLDTLLAAFPQQSKRQKYQIKQMGQHTK